MDFAFIIYSCKKNLNKADLLYSLLKGRLNHCSFYIIYGDPELETDYSMVDDKYIVLKVGDAYEDLYHKTIAVFRTVLKIFPYVRGCFKCDDDVIPHLGDLNNHIDYILRKNPEYSGQNVFHQETYATFHYDKIIASEYKRPIWVPNCNYCPGPLYYLGKSALLKFENKQPDFHLFEDVMVGMHLYVNGIYPDNVPLLNREDISVHNVNNKHVFLFVLLHGRLGNHLFQVCSAYGMAKQSGRKLIIIGDEFLPPVFLKGLLQDDALYICKNDINYLALPRYDETNEQDSSINCFICDPNIVNSFGKDPGLLYGYFQNEKYFSDYKTDILRFLKNDEISARLLSSYPALKNSYFIHVRRGDYVNHPLYVIDYDYYYKTAVFYILDKDPGAHFFIVSDDIEYCKSYPVFSNLNCTFIDNLDSLNTLYFISHCSNGGICCNSSFSWWGSYLNEREDKTVIMPKKWINLSKPVDIFYEGVVVI